MRFQFNLLPAFNTRPLKDKGPTFNICMARIKTICITGHRPNKLGGYESNETAFWVKEQLRQALERAVKRGAIALISSGTIGVGLWAADIIIELKENPEKKPSREIKLVIAQPFESPSSRWPVQERRQYEKILQKANKIVLINDGPAAAYKIQKRNEWMVDHSDAMIAVWDGSEGETSTCINYARKQNKPILIFDPIMQSEKWDLPD
jgi:uncharacterized phage-like protein YoqJ